MNTHTQAGIRRSILGLVWGRCIGRANPPTRKDAPKIRNGKPWFHALPIGLALATALVYSPFTSADPPQLYSPLGPESLVNTTTAGNQRLPSVARNAEGGYVVVWQGDTSLGASTGIFGQLYDLVGNKVGGEFLVNSSQTADVRGRPRVAMDADGDFVVTWTVIDDIRARRFNSAGTPLGVQFQPNTYTTDIQQNPDVAMGVGGNFTIVWESNGQDGDGYGIYGQRYGNDGIALGSEMHISTSTTDRQSNASIAMEANGDFVVAWDGNVFTSGGGVGISARRFNSLGVAFSDAFRVDTNLFDSSGGDTPSVAMDADGDFVIAWNVSNVGTNGTDIRALRYNNAGVSQGGEFSVNTVKTTGSQVTPSVGMDANGNFMIVWRDITSLFSEDNLYVKVYYPDGGIRTSEVVVNLPGIRQRFNPEIALDADGDFVIAWAAANQDGDATGVYAKRYVGTYIELSLNDSGSPDQVAPSGLFNYTLSVSNFTSHSGLTGFAAIDAALGRSTGLKVTASLPSGTSFQSATSASLEWTCPGTAISSITCTRNTPLNMRERTGDLILNLRAPASTGTLSSTASTEGIQADLLTSNNSATVTTTVQAAPPPSLIISDRSCTEGNSGSSACAFTVSLSTSATTAVTVAYSTNEGSAKTTTDTDYTPASGTLTIPAGAASGTINVFITGDTKGEADETFFVNLASPNGATIVDGQGIGTIVNDDVLATLSINDVSVTEGNSGTRNAAFTVTLSAASSSGTTLTFSTANGTATAGSDYVAGGGNLTIPAGATSGTINVVVNGDTAVESDETFTITIFPPAGVGISDGTGQGTIVNDDALPTLRINDVSVTEGDSGTVNAVFTVSLSAASSSAVTVVATTAQGTAVVPSDYVGKQQTLTIPAGQLSVNFVTVVNGDTAVEPDETYFANLTNASGANIADSQGQATIVNDDVAAVAGISTNVTRFNFGNVPVGTSSPQRMLVITSTGTAPLLITKVQPAGDYAGVSGCPRPPAALAPGASCTLTGSFTPTTTGSRPGSVTIQSNAPTSPTVVELNGTGT